MNFIHFHQLSDLCPACLLAQLAMLFDSAGSESGMMLIAQNALFDAPAFGPPTISHPV
jgi:hypothetical protein